MAKGWVTLNVREEVKDGLRSIYNADRRRGKGEAFGKWLDNFLTEWVDNDERINRFGRLLDVENADDNHVIIMDYLRGKHFFVDIVPRKEVILYCQEDESSDCIHVGFCLALPEVYKAIIKKGYIPFRKQEKKGAMKLHRGSVKIKSIKDMTKEEYNKELFDIGLRKLNEKEYEKEKSEKEMLREFTNPEDA